MSQAARDRAGRWASVLIASLAAHLAALLALGVDSRAAGTWESNAIDVTFTVEAPRPDLAPVEAAVADPPAPPDAPRPAQAIALRPLRPAIKPDRAVPAEPDATSLPPPKAGLLLALDPASTARAFVISREVMPSAPSGSEQGESQAGEAETEPRNYFGGVGAKRYLSVRDPPKLRRHQDGTHHYKGHAFKAVVEKDGSVSFDDGYGQGTTISFDISDLMMRRRGEDPYRVEKDWFLEGTAEFRQELFERWKAKQTLLALRKLRIRLLHISEDESLTLGQKSDRVIAMFQDTADDEAGASARNTITEFIAERMPNLRDTLLARKPSDFK